MKRFLKRVMSAALSMVVVINCISGLTFGTSAYDVFAALTINEWVNGAVSTVNMVVSAGENTTVSEGNEAAETPVYDEVVITNVDFESSFTLTIPSDCSKYINAASLTIPMDKKADAVISSDAKSVTFYMKRNTCDAEANTNVAVSLQLVDSTVWINGKDVKAKAAKGTTPAVAADYNKTDTIEVVNMWAGGTWTPVFTKTDVDTAAFKATVNNVVCGKYFDSKGKVQKSVSDATKNIVTAKFSKGGLVITAGKKLSSDTVTEEIYRLWIAEVSADKTVKIIDGKVEPFFYDVAVRIAPTALAVSTVNNASASAAERVVKADKSAIAALNNETRLYINPLGIKSGTAYGAVSPSNSYTVEFAKAEDANYASLKYDPTDNSFIVEGIKLKDGKEYTATVNITSVQAQKTVKLKVIVCNPIQDITFKNGTAEVDGQSGTSVAGSTATAAATASLSMSFRTAEITTTAITDKLAVYVLTSAPNTAIDFSKLFEIKPGKATLKATKDSDVTAKIDGTTITLTEKKGITNDKTVYDYAVATNKVTEPSICFAKVTFTAPVATP